VFGQCKRCGGIAAFSVTHGVSVLAQEVSIDIKTAKTTDRISPPQISVSITL
jgi:hypothetical protein